MLASGHWYSAAGDGATAYVTREDCARADAAALASDDTTRRTLNITGPAALTVAEIAAMATAVLGKPIQVVPVNAEQLAQGMAAAGVPGFLVPLMVSFDLNAAAGRIAGVSDDVQRLTGAPAQALKEWLAANKLAFAA